MGFFDQYPEHKVTRSDKDQDMVNASDGRMARMEEVMLGSLTGECTICGGLSNDVIFGICSSCA